MDTVAFEVFPLDRYQAASCDAVTRLRPKTGVVAVVAVVADATGALRTEPTATNASSATAASGAAAGRRGAPEVMESHRREVENLKE
jgi:hypothetical protein